MVARTGRTTCVTLGSSETLHRVVEAQTETLFANKHGCLLVGRQHRERESLTQGKGGNERDACLTVRCTGHGASQQQHPHYNSHTLAFARPHTTRRFQPVSSAFLLPNTAREDGFDGEATGMSRCLPSGAHVGVVFAWPKSSPDRTRPEFQPVSPVWFFNSPKIIQADHDAKMVEGEPTQ
ncbi:hypothetical protein VNO80_32042 [Phaseolus coccineus]|uniref:Uncharacterized protein n=1 Tax=Phaseolus coccineus TaxID=3886 RepID=A0AAN9L3E9_PHACN